MRHSLVVLCFYFLFSVASHADDLDFITFIGVVTDANKAAVPDALVTARQVATGLERSVKTKADGSFRLTALLPGAYELRVERKDFQTVTLTNLNVVAGTTVTRRLALKPAALAEQVIVDSQISAIEIDFMTGPSRSHAHWIPLAASRSW